MLHRDPVARHHLIGEVRTFSVTMITAWQRMAASTWRSSDRQFQLMKGWLTRQSAPSGSSARASRAIVHARPDPSAWPSVPERGPGRRSRRRTQAEQATKCARPPRSRASSSSAALRRHAGDRTSDAAALCERQRPGGESDVETTCARVPARRLRQDPASATPTPAPRSPIAIDHSAAAASPWPMVLPCRRLPRRQGGLPPVGSWEEGGRRRGVYGSWFCGSGR